MMTRHDYMEKEGKRDVTEEGGKQWGGREGGNHSMYCHVQCIYLSTRERDENSLLKPAQGSIVQLVRTISGRHYQNLLPSLCCHLWRGTCDITHYKGMLWVGVALPHQSTAETHS